MFCFPRAIIKEKDYSRKRIRIESNGTNERGAVRQRCLERRKDGLMRLWPSFVHAKEITVTSNLTVA